MSLNQFFNMLSRMVTNRLMNWGINKGIRQMNSTGGKQTAQQRQREKSARQMVKRARQAARITRRLGR
ncbi:hypothetical protein [Paracoccus ravus]|uniref:hypothetical protein n=1 Tax=Paracoccus ravus TaxID=2447760 RepID=UPI00106E3BF8|nr:hypothetical protein [Paracoccus ravus]